MRVPHYFLFLVVMEIFLLAVLFAIKSRQRKRMTEEYLPYYRMRQEIKDKYARYGAVAIFMMLYAPVFALFTEAWGRKPLLNPLVLFLIISGLLLAWNYAYVTYYNKVVIPKKRNELGEALRKWLTSEIVIRENREKEE